MHSRLKEILAVKGKEVEALKARGLPAQRVDIIPPVRDFKGAISHPDRIRLIAEIKFASPSEGKIREKQDPAALGRMYEEAGASAISLLTDRQFFQGDPDYLPLVRKSVSLPVLRKDFILDEIQVRESSLMGADAILLIARILSRTRLKELLDFSKELGLAALTEVHDREDLEHALACGADIIGINNRNLDTFEVDTNTTLRLAALVPEGHTLVSESGIRDAEDIRRLRGKGIHAVLVGTALMRSGDPGEKTREIVRAGAMK